MVISDSLAYGEVFGALESAGRTLGRQINPTLYTSAEFSRRVRAKNAFVTRVLEQPIGPEVWRVLSKCHDARNRTEYEGALDVDDRLVSELISACREVASKVRQLPALPAAPQ